MNPLPPLAALRAFEAVGRAGTVREAAAELAVSAGAITQHIHTLEKHLDRRLVQRSGRGIELTALGKIYLSHLSKGFTELYKAQDAIDSEKRSNHLLISTYPSLASKWLAPLIFIWKNQNPHSSLMISGVHPEPQLDEAEADFRISYGERHRYHRRYTHLFTDRVVVVASPSLLARSGPIEQPASLLTQSLLWVDWGNEYRALPSWQDWFTQAGVSHKTLHPDVVFSFPAAAIDAAVEGRGFALVQYSLVASALALGSLVRVLPLELPLAEAHFLAWSSSALEKPLGSAFQTWIIHEARRFDTSSP